MLVEERGGGIMGAAFEVAGAVTTERESAGTWFLKVGRRATRLRRQVVQSILTGIDKLNVYCPGNVRAFGRQD